MKGILGKIAITTAALSFSFNAHAQNKDVQKIVSLKSTTGVVVELAEELTLELSGPKGKRNFTLSSLCRKMSGVLHMGDNDKVTVEVKSTADYCVRGNLETLKVFTRFRETTSVEEVAGGMVLKNAMGSLVSAQPDQLPATAQIP